MNEAGYRSPRGDWSFDIPDRLQPKLQADGESTRITLTDLREPKNFFGFKIVLLSQPLGGSSLADATDRLVRDLRAGAAKRDFTEDRRARGRLLEHEAESLEAHYLIDAGRVEYTDQDGKTHSVGDEVLPLRVRLLATSIDNTLVAAWLIADTDRFTALDAIFSKVLRSARWQPPARP